MKTKNKRSTINIHRNKNKTRKIYGGDIDKHNIFRKILSIGYELETMSLAKFTLITTDNENENILLNTDTNSKDYEKMMKLQNGSGSGSGSNSTSTHRHTDSTEGTDEDDYDYYANRLEETLEIDAYTTESLNKLAKQHAKQQAKQIRGSKETRLVKAEDTTFLVANDMAVTPFTKYLNVFCNINDAANTKPNTNTHTHNTKTDGEFIDKNDLYTFETENGGGKYKLNFETWSKKDCGMFSDVEWIMTYYNPKQNKNIILNTFMNVAKNLIFHLNQLEKQSGKLIMNFSEDDKEIMKKSEIRNLYHLPNTNLYYLQTHLIDKQLDIDDICFVPQMTFSCHIKDMVDIFKELAKDSINNFENYKRIADERIAVIGNIEKCINKLFENYNKSAPIVTLTQNVHTTKTAIKLKIVESRNKNLVKSIKNYLFLFL